ncbi:hypothetical protein FRC08_005314 [Ceratobasidium sp. 394]|nr:hypothetical protein FRC08_005314 [Ceratobasidium sp. 394]KAG9100585.1 hypothetical protein FS749_014338 [Ceratobasidium sp. UAMH 11750]
MWLVVVSELILAVGFSRVRIDANIYFLKSYSVLFGVYVGSEKEQISQGHRENCSVVSDITPLMPGIEHAFGLPLGGLVSMCVRSFTRFSSMSEKGFLCDWLLASLSCSTRLMFQPLEKFP